MSKTFGKKKAGTIEPETKSTFQEKKPEEKGNNVLKLLFGILAAVAVGLFAYNNFFASEPQAPETAEVSKQILSEPVAPTLGLRSSNATQTQRFPELDHYLEAQHVNPDRARIHRYGRTSTLLAECGSRFDAVRRDYQRENHAAYQTLNGREAIVEESDIVNPVPADQSFSRAISAAECSHVSQRVRLGEQNI